MAPYLIAFIMPVALAPLRSRSRIAYVFALAAVWAAFAGLRGDIGGLDYYAYRDMYLGLIPGKAPPVTYEPAFMALARAARFLGLPYNGFLSIVALLGILPAVHVIEKHTDGSELGLFAYGIEFMLGMAFVYLRQGIATGFAFLVLDAAIDGKRLRGVLCGILAFGFHYSAVVLLAFAFLRHSIGPKTRTAAYALAGAAGIFIITRISFGTFSIPGFPLFNRLSLYLANGGEMKINPLNFIEALLISAVMRRYLDNHLQALPPAATATLNNAFAIFAIFIIFGTIEAIFIRFASYFKIGVPVIIAIAAANAVRGDAMHDWFSRRMSKLFGPSWFSALVFLYYFAKISRWLILNANVIGGFLPYRLKAGAP